MLSETLYDLTWMSNVEDVEISNMSFCWFIPRVAEIISDIMKNAWLFVEYFMFQCVIDENLKVVGIWSKFWNLSDFNLGELVCWEALRIPAVIGISINSRTDMKSSGIGDHPYSWCTITINTIVSSSCCVQNV